MLKIKDLTLIKGKKSLISNIDLELYTEFLYPIVGPNGSGKTTLLKILAGIWPPSQGDIQWKGETLLKKPRKEISNIISFVPQTPLIPFEFTVEQFVNMGLYAQGLCNTEKGKHLIRESLEILDSLSMIYCSINELSQGEKQRVFIARALVAQTPILAFDEPTASLDKSNQILVWNLMEQLTLKNKIVIVATHDLQNCQKFSQQIISLEEGKLCK